MGGEMGRNWLGVERWKTIIRLYYVREKNIFTKGKEPNIYCKYYMHVTSTYTTVKIYADLDMKHFCRVSKQMEWIY